MAESVPKKSSGLRRKASLKVVFAVKKKSRNPTYLKVYKILQKSEKDRSKEENELLSSSASIVNQVLTRLEKRQQILAREKEFEDCAQLLEEKCAKLAIAIAGAKHLVVYSGAGVSTAAKIPDYRGTNGIWTRLQQGKDIGDHDLSIAEPTTAHMALYSLYKNSLLKYIVSQNCDGLHLRSGLPRRVLSEVHGNMNLEVCEMCNIQYWRAFDVTTHTARYAHQTARRCSGCTCPLRDTIVHFGERGSLAWPINWAGACHAAKQADMILCIGSSLKVLKRYPWLWGMDKPVSKRPKLYIVNLQWTPKDFQATLKINGKCDEVMKLVMGYLNIEIPKYDRSMDPIFHHCTMLHPLEEHTISSALMLVPPDIKRFKKEAIDIDQISQHKLDEIVYGIKKEEIIWRPFGREIILNSGRIIKEEDAIAEEPCHSNISVEADIFDQVYQEIAKKVLQQTNTAYYQSIYEPLDLSKPECQFCYDSCSSSCMFYPKRTAKVPEKGRPCYCCDSDDDTSDNGGSDQADRKAPCNPGWFGKGYRKKIKKKRFLSGTVSFSGIYQSYCVVWMFRCDYLLISIVHTCCKKYASVCSSGDRAIGKTSIVNMFVSDGREYPKNYTMTFAAEISVKSVHIPNTTDAVELIIYDCPGIDLYSDLLINFWNGPDLLMVVFDVTNKKSLDSVEHWVSLAKKAKWRGSNGSPITSILLGNKTDLQDRLVCKEADAVQIADRLNMKSFFGSARNNQGLEDPFQFLADSFYKHSLKNYS